MDNTVSKALIFQTVEDFDSKAIQGKIVFTNGCFDLLHSGHLNTLVSARALGDLLVVGLNHDSSVKKIKGVHRPVHGWEERAFHLSMLRCVDVVIGFEEDTPLKLIRQLRPDIITKGGDYKMNEMIGREFVTEYGGEVVILPYLKGHSTTKLIKTLKKGKKK